MHMFYIIISILFVADFVGTATVQVSDLRRTPSSRQILPLSNQKSSNTRASLTVEVSKQNKEIRICTLKQLGNLHSLKNDCKSLFIIVNIVQCCYDCFKHLESII